MVSVDLGLRGPLIELASEAVNVPLWPASVALGFWGSSVAVDCRPFLFSGLRGCGLFSTVVSVAVDCRQFCLNGLSGCGPWVPFFTGLSGCGPWVPFFTGLSGSGISCVIASVAVEQFCSVTSVVDLTLLGPLAATVAVDLWVYFIILCGCWTGVSVNHFLYVFLQMLFIMVFGRKIYTCRTRG